jgi:uncharacterized protein YndB with AHSA1/START domain
LKEGDTMTATETTTIHNTFVIERSYPQPPNRVYGAFAQPTRKRRWYAEGDHEIQEFEMDFRVGGSEWARYSFKEGHPLAGRELTNQTTFEDIVPEKRIIEASTMSLNGQPISVVLVTFEFVPTASGTDLICTHQGAFFEGSGGPEMREKGWQVLFDRLGKELAS